MYNKIRNFCILRLLSNISKVSVLIEDLQKVKSPILLKYILFFLILLEYEAEH